MAIFYLARCSERTVSSQIEEDDSSDFFASCIQSAKGVFSIRPGRHERLIATTTPATEPHPVLFLSSTRVRHLCVAPGAP